MSRKTFISSLIEPRFSLLTSARNKRHFMWASLLTLILGTHLARHLVFAKAVENYVLGSSHAQQAPYTPLPGGWILRPNPGLYSDVRQCANLSDRQWEVFGKQEVTIVRYKRKGPTKWQLPFEPNLAEMLPDASAGYLKHARRHVTKFENGWLIGLDAGEWGGGLWWFDADGTGSKIWHDNVVALVSLNEKPLALVGLDHGYIKPGKILRVLPSESGARVEKLAELDGEPRAWFSQDGSLLIVTAHGLYRVLPSHGEKIMDLQLDWLGPNSVVRLASGEVYIGMSLFVLRLRPDGEHYREEWFIPEDCQRFEVRGPDCFCIGGIDKPAK